MKRKLLFVSLMLALFACMLAVSVSASTIYKDVDGNELFSYESESIKNITSEQGTVTYDVISTFKGELAKVDENGTPLTWYITSTNTVDGNTVYTVASLPTVQAEGYDSYAGTVNSSGAFNYVGTINKRNVVSANFPDNAGILSFGFGAFGGYGSRSQNRLLFCYMPNTITVLDGSIFQETPVLFVEMDDETPIKEIPYKFAHGAHNLRSVHIPASVEIIKSTNYNNGVSFYQTYSLERVTFSEKSQLKTIEQFAFAQSGVKYITLPDCLETLGSKAFVDSGIVYGPFTENSRCTTWGNHIFRNCDSLKSFIIPGTLSSVAKHDRWEESSFALSDNIELITYGKGANNSTLFAGMFASSGVKNVIFPEGITHIPARMFYGCTAIKEVSFPNSVETAGERVFQGAAVEIIRFGNSFKCFSNTSVDHHSFTNVASNIKEIYIPSSFYKDAPDTVYRVSYAFNCGNSSNIKFYYTGTLEELAVSLDNFKSSTKSATDNNWKFLNATQISYADYIASPDSYQNGNYIIYGYNVCDAFYEGKHQNEVSITYSDYAKAGIKTSACQNGCGLRTEESVDAIISYKGVSAKIDGNKICIGYVVNLEAKSEFESVNNTSLIYGVVASASSITTNSPLKAENGSVVALIPSKTVNASISDTYTGFDFVMGGFTEANYATELVMCAYVYDGKNIGYMCSVNGQLTQLKEATTITYNQIANSN